MLKSPHTQKNLYIGLRSDGGAYPTSAGLEHFIGLWQPTLVSLKSHAVFFTLIGEPCHPEAVLTTLLLICCPVHVTVVCEWHSRAVGAKAQLGVRVSEKRCWRWRHCR